jgi:hypothetical protein
MTQIDFLDELRGELDGAAARLIRARRQRRRRGLLVPAAALAAVAAAVLLLWPGAPLDPEREVASPPAAQTAGDLLGVLRRPENAADRGAEARAGRERVAAMLEGDESFRQLGAQGAVLGADDDEACVHHRFGDGGVQCWAIADIAKGRAYTAVGEHVLGLAPDGVTSVAVSFLGDEATADVQDNFYVVDAKFQSVPLLVTTRNAAGTVVTEDVIRAPDAEVMLDVPEATVRKAQALARSELVRVEPSQPQREEMAELAAIVRRVPLPPGFSDDPADEVREQTSLQGFQPAVEQSAACLWRFYWLLAAGAGNERVAAQAARVLEIVPRWPGPRDDPRPHERAAAAAADGDAASMARRSLATPDCA